MLKLNIRGKTISYSSYKAKKIRQEEDTLEKNIHKLQELLVKTERQCIEQLTLSHMQSDLEVLKERLVKLREPKLKAMILRARAQYYEQGERSHKLLLNLEKKNSISKVISRLNIKGQIIENQDRILKEMRNYYKNLYTSKSFAPDTSPKFLTDKNIKN